MMKRRRFLKTTSTALVAALIAPSIAYTSEPKEEKYEWEGKLIVMGLYYDGENTFCAVSKDKAIPIDPEIEPYKPKKLIAIGSSFTK